MIDDDQHTGKNEQWVSQFDQGEATQVAGVDQVGEDAEEGKRDGESIEQDEEDLNADDGVYETTEQFSSKDGMFLDQFREVIQARC